MIAAIGNLILIRALPVTSKFMVGSKSPFSQRCRVAVQSVLASGAYVSVRRRDSKTRSASCVNISSPIKKCAPR